jgi:hypothetical protein
LQSVGPRIQGKNLSVVMRTPSYRPAWPIGRKRSVCKLFFSWSSTLEITLWSSVFHSPRNRLYYSNSPVPVALQMRHGWWQQRPPLMCM